MVKRLENKNRTWLENNRFTLLLVSTLMLLVFPAFAGIGLLNQIIYVVTLSFLFLQSMVVADFKKSSKRVLRIIVLWMIVVIWLKPLGIESAYLDYLKLFFIIFFFTFIILHLARFIARSTSVNMNVLITSINIYLLAGIVGANLAMVCYKVFPYAYNFPDYIVHPEFSHFLYYSFITLTTVGYGDITPIIAETQTLAYLISITGQLYVAIIIAFLIGKFLMQGNQKRMEDRNEEMGQFD